MIIHPSSRSADHLIVTWKVTNDSYAHIEVLEKVCCPLVHIVLSFRRCYNYRGTYCTGGLSVVEVDQLTLVGV